MLVYMWHACTCTCTCVCTGERDLLHQYPGGTEQKNRSARTLPGKEGLSRPLWGVSCLGVSTPWRDSWGVSTVCCRAAKLGFRSYWTNGRGRKMSSWPRKRQHRNEEGPRRQRGTLNSWSWTRNAKNRRSKWSRCCWRESVHERRQQRKNQSECVGMSEFQ